MVDDPVGAGHHESRLQWILPDLPFETIGASPFCAVLSGEKVRFRWNVFSSSPGDAAVIRGGKSLSGGPMGGGEELLGWESPTYGERWSAISLLLRVQGALPGPIV